MMVVILLVAFTLISLGLMMASSQTMPRVFRYTTMGPDRSKITFLIHSNSTEDANTKALTALTGQNQKIVKIEELDPEDHSLIEVLYQQQDPPSVKVKQIKQVD